MDQVAAHVTQLRWFTDKYPLLDLVGDSAAAHPIGQTAEDEVFPRGQGGTTSLLTVDLVIAWLVTP